MTDPRLQELLDKQEIREVLARWCRGLDRADLELMSSTYHDDAIDRRGPWSYHGENPAADYIERHQKYKKYLHFTLNEQIEIDGDVARCESYFMAQLTQDFDGVEKLVRYGGRHLDRFERRDGVWRIADRLALLEWRTLTDVDPLPDFPIPASHRSREDPSYRIP